MKNHNLCIDRGNTLIKAGVFDGAELKQKFVFQDYEELYVLLQENSFDQIIISSTKRDESDFVESVAGQKIKVFSYDLPLPVVNKYHTPETLGKDRLAGVIGAKFLFPVNHCLVVDAGTCITYDLVTAKGEYLGGAISPGLQMRYKALNHFTARLPLINPSENHLLTGTDTTTSIISGVQNGLIYEIERIIKEYSDSYPDLKVILCGGDASFFESKIKGTIFAFPDLVLLGLNHTLLYNAPK